jgi:hypothetical protein
MTVSGLDLGILRLEAWCLNLLRYLAGTLSSRKSYTVALRIVGGYIDGTECLELQLVNLDSEEYK